MEIALQFEATHFAQIRRYYQSITPTRSTVPRQLDLFEKHPGRNSRKAQYFAVLIPASHPPLGSILWFDPRREHSSVPTAKSRSRRAQGLSRLAASSRPPFRAWP
jgi:hypothetical protein